jgi:hypothetical protein
VSFSALHIDRALLPMKISGAFFFFVRDQVNPRIIVRMEILDKLEKKLLHHRESNPRTSHFLSAFLSDTILNYLHTPSSQRVKGKVKGKIIFVFN